MNLSQVVEQEREKLKSFFNKEFVFFPPEISQSDFKKIYKFGFDLHFFPQIEITENEQFPGWREKPKNNFFNLIKKEKLLTSATSLLNKWVFIENRKKPQKNCWWITKDDLGVKILNKILHFDFKKYCQKISRQQYEEDFLLPILKENGFTSRFSLTWREIEEIIKPEVAKLLREPIEKIRLPRFIEWNFLGNAFYPEWGRTSTWEWLNDRLSTGECLTVGSNGLSVIGWDPPDFWSTILGFRFLIEI